MPLDWKKLKSYMTDTEESCINNPPLVLCKYIN